MSLAINLRLRRSRMKMSQKRLAERAGVSQQLIHALEAGTTRSSRFMEQIAAALDCAASDLDARPSLAGTSPVKVRSDQTGSAELAVFSSAEQFVQGVPQEAAAIDIITRPHPLLNIRNAYGLLILDGNMSPEFEPGDYALINPHMPAMVDTSCLFFSERAVQRQLKIARLTEISDQFWHAKQWRPASDQSHDFSLDRSQWSHCHRIIGRYCRR